MSFGGRGSQHRYSKGWNSSESSRRSGPAPKLEGKTFKQIREECLRNGCLFEDPDFPAIDHSIFFSKSPPRPFVWKRPKEFCPDAKLFVGGANRFDIQQGELGDCWLLAAVASLCQYKDLFYRVVPQDQSFDNEYAGVFHFQFWRFGKWTDCIIDDKLPTYNNRLVFMHSSESNEFWSALLEKAYAKLHGSYEALKGGATSEAMEDFTGGMTEMYDFRQSLPPNMFQILLKAYARQSLMGCSIEVEIQTSRTKGKIPLIRVRNPWGNEAEWKGAWSDKSQEWNFIPADERQSIGLSFDDDGEFWMSFQDFSKNFQKVEICNLGPDSLAVGSADPSKIRFEETQQHGTWKRKVCAGGCRNYLETFWTNPQYRVQVVDADDDSDDLGTIIVALMQKERRKGRKEGMGMLTLGYAIYKLEDPNTGPLDLKFFKFTASTAKSPSFINLREVCGRHSLPPGQYCIVPSTFEPGQEGNFLLRIYSEKKSFSNEIDEQTSLQDPKEEEIEQPKEDDQQDESLRQAFRKISGPDLEIDAYELMEILNQAFMKEFTFDGFTADTCRSLVAMMDADRSGKLGYDEFRKLWGDLRTWKAVFKKYDTDKSGTFNSFELRQAFHTIGLRVSNSTFNALVMRYSHRNGKIYFDDFIHCTARLKTMFELFAEMRNSDNRAVFEIDEFIQTTMYS